MLAVTTHHELMLIVAVILFFVAGAVRAWSKSLDGTLVAVGLAVAFWSFLVTT